MTDPLNHVGLAIWVASIYSKKMYYASRKHGFPDIRQEAMIGLLIACEKYDAARGASFSTFASRVIWNYLKYVTRHHEEEIRAFDVNHKDTTTERPREWSQEVLAYMTRLKSTEQAMLVRYFWDDWSMRKIGNYHGVSKQYIQQVISNALAQIKERIEDES